MCVCVLSLCGTGAQLRARGRMGMMMSEGCGVRKYSLVCFWFFRVGFDVFSVVEDVIGNCAELDTSGVARSFRAFHYKANDRRLCFFRKK